MKENFEIPVDNQIEQETQTDSVEKITSKDSIIKKALKKLGITSALLASLTGGAMTQEKHTDDPFGKEKLRPIARKSERMRSVGGEEYVGVKNIDDVFVGMDDRDSDGALVLQQNIKKPESLEDLGKMILEPMSVSLSFPYGKNHVVAIVRTALGYKNKEAQIVDIEIPYKYAQDFDNADPINREKMKEQAMQDAEKLLEKISTDVFGLSFFQKSAEEHHREFSAPITKVNALDVEGFASPESTDGVNLQDIRNQKLSKLRGENAAKTIRELFKDKNIGVDEVTFHGSGEKALSQEELKQLSNEAVILDLSNPKDPQSVRVLEIIKEYNDGKITEESALKILEDTIGSKRKVAVHLELDEEKKILVLPIPLILGVPWLIKKMGEFDDWRRLRSAKGLPHSFIRTEDPSKPTVRIPQVGPSGVISHIDVGRLEIEAQRFFNSYNPQFDRFFMVSSDDTNDLETANAYRLTAENGGFDVIRPDHTRGDVNNITDGFVRVIKSLNVDPNKNTQQLYEREFKNLIKLLNFGEERITENLAGNPDRRQIHILAFGQEPTVIEALNRFFREQGINNLEVIGLAGTNRPTRARANFRGKTRRIR